MNLNNHWSLDVEADGPAPGLYSMVSFGMVNVADHRIAYYGELRPISDKYQEDALKVCGFTREQTMGFKSPEIVMADFIKFMEGNRMDKKRFITWSDNPGFDWGFLNYYMHAFTGGNMLGWSCRRIGDLYAGSIKELGNSKWKRLKKTKHTHNAMDDATGNAEALAEIIQRGHIK